MANLLKDLWIAELQNKFRHDKEFLRAIPRRDDLVNNDVIHWADIGADPDVLVNYTTSNGIPMVARTDSDATISLDKFQTKRTPITDDELYALPYDKEGSVIRQHREVLEDKTAEYAIHNIAPTTAVTGTKLILTSGGTNGATHARKRMLVADIIAAKKHMDALDVPRSGRLLVLSPDHVEDLLLISESFEKQYQNIREGQVLRMYGFDIYEFTKTPLYSVVSTVLTKKAIDAAAAPTTDQVSSVFFYAPNTLQALGSVKMYHKKAEDNPEYQQSEVNFRLYHKCFAKSLTGFGAIVAATV